MGGLELLARRPLSESLGARAMGFEGLKARLGGFITGFDLRDCLVTLVPG